MIDVLKEVAKKIEFFRGWFPDVDQRMSQDPPEESFQELIGFDPTRIQGMLSKDFGYSNQYFSAPHYRGTGTYGAIGTVITGVGTHFTTELAIGGRIFVGTATVGMVTLTLNQIRTVTGIADDTHCTIDQAFSTEFSGALFMIGIKIIGQQSFYVTALNQEFETCWGLGALGQLKFFVQPYFSIDPANDWIELTESVLGNPITAIDVGTNTMDITVTVDYPTNYFRGWLAATDRGRSLFCTASTKLTNTSQRLTIQETILNFSSFRLDPDADISTGSWTPAPLFSKINDGDIYNDTNSFTLDSSKVDDVCEVSLSNLTGTPYASGKTRLYFRAFGGGFGASYLKVELMSGATSVANKTVTLGGKPSSNFVDVLEIANSLIGTLTSDWSDLRIRFTGNTSFLSSITIYFAKVLVETTTALATINLYRFPVCAQDAPLWSSAGAMPLVASSKGRDKLEWGWRDTARTRQNPMMLKLINTSFFADFKGAFQRNVNQLYFERAGVDLSSMLKGITITRSVTTAFPSFQVVIIPLIDGYQMGDPIYDAIELGSMFTFDVEWAAFNKRITALLIFAEVSADNTVPAYDRINYVVKLSTTDTSTIWKTNYDNKLSTSFDLAGVQKSSLTINQYRGASHTSGLVKWTKRIQMSKQQTSLVAVDESDDAVRLSFYDSFAQHEDDVFPNVGQDKNGVPLLIFIGIEGRLLAFAELNGHLYVFKTTGVQITNLVNFSSIIVVVDCIAENGVCSTIEGVVFLGIGGIYIFPRHGGLHEFMNNEFVETYRNIPVVYKRAGFVQEAQHINSIVVSLQTGASQFTQFIYNTVAKIWWKRRWSVNPTWLSKREDGTLEFTDGKYIFQYPDRSTYYDIDTFGLPTAQYWEIRSQWLTLGYDEAYKVLRTVIPVVLGGSTSQVSYQLEIYFDRKTTPFDMLFGASIINDIQEKALLLRTPNSFREIQFRIIHDPNFPNEVVDRFDLTGMRMYGETFTSPIDQ